MLCVSLYILFSFYTCVFDKGKEEQEKEKKKMLELEVIEKTFFLRALVQRLEIEFFNPNINVSILPFVRVYTCIM